MAGCSAILVPAVGPVPRRLARTGGCRGAASACLGGQGANPLRNAPARGEGTPAPPGRRQRWVSGQLPCWSSDRDRWRQGWPQPRTGVLAVPGSPALATGSAIPPSGGAGRILPRAAPRALCLAARGGRRHPPSPGAAPHTRGALRGISICSGHQHGLEAFKKGVTSPGRARGATVGYCPQSWPPGGCQAPLPVGADLGQAWGDGAGEPPAAAPAPPSHASGSWPPCGAQRWGCGMCRIGARRWAGFLWQKIPGRLHGSAGGPGLAVSPAEPRVGEPCWHEPQPAGGLQRDLPASHWAGGCCCGCCAPVWVLGDCGTWRAPVPGVWGGWRHLPWQPGAAPVWAGSGVGWRSGAGRCLQSPHFAPH